MYVAIGLRPCTFTLNMKHTVEDMPRLHKLFHRDKHRTGYSLQTWSWWFFIYIYFAHIDLLIYFGIILCFISIYIFALSYETDLKPSMCSLRLNLSVSVRKSINEIISALHFFIFFFCCLLFHLMFFLYIL